VDKFWKNIAGIRSFKIRKHLTVIITVFAVLVIAFLYFAYDKTDGHIISQILGISIKATPAPAGVPIRIFATPVPRIIQTAPTEVPQQDMGSTVSPVDCVGPDGKHLEVTKQMCDDFNLAWHPELVIVTCRIDSQCGGGTIQLQRGVCENSTCCQIGDKWTFYQDKNKCVQDQNIYNVNLPTPTLLPTSTPTPIPTPTQQEINLQLYNQCISNVQNAYNQQRQECLSLYGGGKTGMACIQRALQVGQQAINNCNTQYPH
jgi:hypothetical protein